MSLQTGENDQGLRKIIDLTRMISIVVLLLHCYFNCYFAFKQWHWTAPISDRLLNNLVHSGVFNNFNKSKIIALGFLLISLFGVKGRKDEKLKYKTAVLYLIIGLALYFLSIFFFYLTADYAIHIAVAYMATTALGYLLIMTGGGLFTRIIKYQFSSDVFNKANETFPQEERLLQNEYSINLPAKYNLKVKFRNSWINVINPMRGLLIMGSPGSGKSYFIIQNVIKQHIEKVLRYSFMTLNMMT